MVSKKQLNIIALHQFEGKDEVVEMINNLIKQIASDLQSEVFWKGEAFFSQKEGCYCARLTFLENSRIEGKSFLLKDSTEHLGETLGEVLKYRARDAGMFAKKMVSSGLLRTMIELEVWQHQDVPLHLYNSTLRHHYQCLAQQRLQ